MPYLKLLFVYEFSLPQTTKYKNDWCNQYIMVFFTAQELIDLIIMTFALGYIFMDRFQKPLHDDYDPIKHFSEPPSYRNFWFAIAVVAPAIILHEMGHKFVALSYGLEAVFHMSFAGLMIGIVLKLINFGFIVFVPGYVSILGDGTALQSAIIAFAGPGMNLALWIFAALALKYNLLHKKYHPYLALTKNINLFLFVFNLLPIPPFDGYQVFSNLFQTIF